MYPQHILAVCAAQEILSGTWFLPVMYGNTSGPQDPYGVYIAIFPRGSKVHAPLAVAMITADEKTFKQRNTVYNCCLKSAERLAGLDSRVSSYNLRHPGYGHLMGAIRLSTGGVLSVAGLPPEYNEILAVMVAEKAGYISEDGRCAILETSQNADLYLRMMSTLNIAMD